MGSLSDEPEILIDKIPSYRYRRRASFLPEKSGDRINIDAANVGELDISFSELGNRIGTGMPYLRHLMSRLSPFHDLLFKAFLMNQS